MSLCALVHVLISLYIETHTHTYTHCLAFAPYIMFPLLNKNWPVSCATVVKNAVLSFVISISSLLLMPFSTVLLYLLRWIWQWVLLNDTFIKGKMWHKLKNGSMIHVCRFQPKASSDYFHCQWIYQFFPWLICESLCLFHNSSCLYHRLVLSKYTLNYHVKSQIWEAETSKVSSFLL